MFLALMMPVTAKGTVGRRIRLGEKRINVFITNSPPFFGILGIVETQRNRDGL